MKIAAQNNPSTPKKAKLTPEQIRAKLKGKFGDKIQQKTKSDKVEISQKQQQQEQNLDVHQVATVGKNDPDSLATKDKLRELLKHGGFDFNQKERQTLAKILN